MSTNTLEAIDQSRVFESTEPYALDPADFAGELVSECCGEPDRDTGGCDVSWGDLGLCSCCHEHCEYVEVEA